MWIYYWLKKKIPNGLRNSISRLPNEIGIALRHRRAANQARKFCGSIIKLHLGCYNNIKIGYVNIDLENDDSLHLDLREKLPFDSQSVSEIYSEHLWEHLPEQYAMQLFIECHRVMTPGGLFTIGVPDTQILLESYVNKLPVNDFKLINIEKDLPPNPTRLQIVNLLFRGFGHHYMYDYETTEKLLSSVGFIEIHRRAFDPAKDSPHRRDWTLYIDAYKPS